MLVAAGALVGTFFGGAATVGAQDDYVRTRPATVTRDPVRPAAPAEPDTKVLGRVVTRSAPIPITGGDVAGLVAVGMGAIGTGTLLLRRGRRAPR